MQHKGRIVLGACVAVFLLLLALDWTGGRVELVRHRLRFEPGNGAVRPLFVMVTHGQLHTNYVTRAPGIKEARVGYIHTFYYAPQNSVQPVSPLRYQLGELLSPVLRRFRLWDRFVVPKIEGFDDTESVLWFGYSATNSIFSEEAVLLSDQGLRLPLSDPVELTLTNLQHLITWRMPVPFTKPGKYRLTLTETNQTLLTILYP
jgi:hypothetical protein